MKLPTKLHQSVLRPMTREQAQRYGEKNMPADLKRAGFQCLVFRATMDINGWDGYRINYGKKC